jgi:hypothetical protein
MSQKPFDLTERVVLMRLVLGMAGTKRKSKAMTKAAAEATETDESRTDGNVHLFDNDDLDEIQAIQSAARGYFYSRTSPWDDNAYRVCPVALYGEVKGTLKDFDSKHIDAVERLVGRRDEFAAEYIRTVGKHVAAEIPFPSAERLRMNFRLEVHEMALARTQDVRFGDLDPKVFEELKRDLTEGMTERLAEAQAELIDRIRKTVERVKRVTGKEKGRIYDTLGTAVQEIVEVLPQLNLTDDPKVARAIKLVAKELGGIDVETLKTDTKARQATHKAASSVLDHLMKL